MTVVPYDRREPAWVALQNPALELANQIAGTDFVPNQLRNNPAAIAAAVLFGAEVGLGPMMSLSRIAVVNGRPTIAAEAQRALILAAGHDLWVEESGTSRCTVCGRRKDSEATSRVTWTMDDAKRAGLAGKSNWRLYPRQMLFARASAELARAVFPDAIGGLAATEELEDNTPDAPNGPAAPQEPTRRRRRANVTSAPASPAAEQPAPSPTAPPEATGGLPPDEQAIVDALTQELDAQPADERTQISDSQRRKLHAMFRSRDIDDRDARLSYCSNVLGRPIGSSTELTMDEASTVIDHLDQLDMNDPATWPPIPESTPLDALEQYEAEHEGGDE